MPDEQVKVILSADIRPYLRDMGRAATATKEFSREMGHAEDAVDSASREMKDAGDATERAAKEMDHAGDVTDKAADDMKRAAKEMDRAGDASDDVAKAQKDVGDQAGKNAAKWAAVGTAITVAGAKALEFLGDTIEAASDLNESLSKMQTVFGDAAGAIEEMGKTADQSLGLSQQAFYDAASTMGVFGKAAGLTGDKLATFSTDMLNLSGDLASFYNSSPEDAMEAIGAALRGESEPIRRYGVMLDDASLKAVALREGLISSTKDGLTPQTKALAAQKAILEQTAVAQGDFARTGDGLANSQRKMEAAVQNSKAAFGEALLPMMAKGVQAVTGFIKVFNGLPGPIRNTIALITGATALVALVAPGLAILVAGLRKARGELALYTAQSNLAAAATGRLSGAMASAGGAKGLGMLATKAGIAGAIIAALFIGLDKLATGIRNAKTAALADDLAEAAKNGQSLKDVLDAMGRRPTNKAPDASGSTGSNYRTDLNPGGSSLVPKMAALDKYLTSAAPEEAAEQYAILVKEWDAAGRSVDYLNTQLPGYVQLRRDAAQATDAEGVALESAAEGQKKLNDAQDKALGILTGYINAKLSAAGAADTLAGAEDRLRKAHKANSSALSGNTDKAMANRDALRGEISAVLSNAEAKVEAAKAGGATTVESYRIGNEAIKEGRKKLEEAAVAAGYNKTEVKKMLDEYMKVPKDVKTKIDATGIDHATGAVEDYNSELSKIPGSMTTHIIAKWETTYAGGWDQYAEEHGLPHRKGGKILGPGTGTSDSVAIRASAGEWVIKAESAARYGDEFMAALNAGTLPRAGRSDALTTASRAGTLRPAPINLRMPAAQPTPPGSGAFTINATGWNFAGMNPNTAGRSVVTALAEVGYRQGVR